MTREGASSLKAHVSKKPPLLSNTSLTYSRRPLPEGRGHKYGHRAGSDALALGRGFINAQPQAHGRKLDECEVVGCELVVSGCYLPTVLDLVAEPRDQVARLVKIWAEALRLCPISFRWDVRRGLMRTNEGSDPVRVIATVAISLKTDPLCSL